MIFVHVSSKCLPRNHRAATNIADPFLAMSFQLMIEPLMAGLEERLAAMAFSACV